MEHSINLVGNKLEIKGVKEVLSFDLKQVTLDITDQSLVIKGDNIVISELAVPQGMLKLEGKILSIVYGRSLEKTSFMKKLFK